MSEPLRLSKGAVIFGYPVSALRTEARKGRLVLLRVAGRDYVTAQAVREMERLCKNLKAQGCTFTSEKAVPPSGLSGTERNRLALASLEMSMTKLKKPSSNTVRRTLRSTPDNVTYLKS